MEELFSLSHILEVAERMCTRVAVIDHGRVLATLDNTRGPGEDLEDIFIRLVGASVAEIESRNKPLRRSDPGNNVARSTGVLQLLALKFLDDVSRRVATKC